MCFKIITIRKEVYEKLKALKRKNQSFSDVIEDLIDQKQELLAFFGAWELEGEEFETNNKILKAGWMKWENSTHA